MPFGKIDIDERHQFLAWLRARDRPGEALDRLRARLLRGRGEKRVARSEMRVKAAVREPGFAHHVGYADPFVAVPADRARRSAQDARAGLLFL